MLTGLTAVAYATLYELKAVLVDGVDTAIGDARPLLYSEPERRARSGSSGSTTPESGRSRKQFLLRVTDEERETIESTRREGESSSAAVVRLAREEIDRGKTRDS